MSTITLYKDTESKTISMGQITFTVDKNTLYYGRLCMYYLDDAREKKNKYSEIHSTFYSIDDFFSNFSLKVENLISDSVAKAVQILMDEGIYDKSEKYILDLISISTAWAKILDKISDMEDQYEDITDKYEEDLEYRELRKDSRSRAVGGGFGLTGYIKGAATAGAINMATGVAHGVINAVGNLGSAIEKSASANSLYNNTKTKQFFAGQVFNVIMTIPDIIYETVVPNQSKPSFSKVNSIFTNLSNHSCSDEQRSEMYIKIFSSWPFNPMYYKEFLQDYSDVDGSVGSAARFFGLESDINKIKVDLLCNSYKEIDQGIENKPSQGHNNDYINKYINISKDIKQMADKLSIDKQFYGDILNIKVNNSISQITYNELSKKVLIINGESCKSIEEAQEKAILSDKLYNLQEYANKDENIIHYFTDTSRNLKQKIYQAYETIQRIDQFAQNTGLNKEQYVDSLTLKIKKDDSNKENYKGNTISLKDLCSKCFFVDGKKYDTIENAYAAAENFDTLSSVFYSVNKDNITSVLNTIEKVKNMQYEGASQKAYIAKLNEYEKALRTVNGVVLNTYEEAEKARGKVNDCKKYVAEKYGNLDLYRFTNTGLNNVKNALEDINNVFGKFADLKFVDECKKYVEECQRINNVDLKKTCITSGILAVGSIILSCIAQSSNIGFFSIAALIILIILYTKVRDIIKKCAFIKEIKALEKVRNNKIVPLKRYYIQVVSLALIGVLKVLTSVLTSFL